MTRTRILLALLLVLWGAPALAQNGAEDMNDQPAGEVSLPGLPTEEGVADDDLIGEDAADGDAVPEDVAAAGEDVADLEDPAEAGSDGADPWTFEAIDVNGDNALTAQEFGSGLFEIVADDGEGLSQEGFLLVVDTFTLDPERFSFASVDQNDDRLVTAQDEFVPGVASAVFDEFDLDDDALLTPDEYASNMYATLDIDEDDLVTSEEFEPYIGWFAEAQVEEIAGGGAPANSIIDKEFFFARDDTEITEPGFDESEIDATEQKDIGGPGDETEGAAGGGAGQDAGDVDEAKEGGAGEDAGDGAAGRPEDASQDGADY
ncbi:MAG TPA: hypothetical protein VF168_07465 [Trueperaceae bacterium]